MCQHLVVCVSVLFSEPKIPQCKRRWQTYNNSRSFSALQRAENSSIEQQGQGRCSAGNVSVLFSEPKIPQSVASSLGRRAIRVSVLFSEPKIPQSSTVMCNFFASPTFQCSSASRKFLNRVDPILPFNADECFSALQRAENSSMAPTARRCPRRCRFSALQRAENSSITSPLRYAQLQRAVSVLFSEPKIPQ